LAKVLVAVGEYKVSWREWVWTQGNYRTPRAIQKDAGPSFTPPIMQVTKVIAIFIMEIFTGRMIGRVKIENCCGCDVPGVFPAYLMA